MPKQRDSSSFNKSKTRYTFARHATGARYCGWLYVIKRSVELPDYNSAFAPRTRLQDIRLLQVTVKGYTSLSAALSCQTTAQLLRQERKTEIDMIRSTHPPCISKWRDVA
eukprot:TRINITY_DN42696_c0_g1_i1.p1 TRINITY_DN42696_c0_g1~~TRINITY_DN42696_c0_g1_i1.p1  ORF type:complete len:110 (-),score=2.32 TRINITY_DN42696_c0_g1_i1:387-716(-)